MQQNWDTALVRHIYDVHCIRMRQPELIKVSAKAFRVLVEGDVAEFGRQHPEFLADPLGVLRGALDRVGTDEQCRAEYVQNLMPLVYGNVKPSFEEAFASFDTVARALLGAVDAARAAE